MTITPTILVLLLVTLLLTLRPLIRWATWAQVNGATMLKAVGPWIAWAIYFGWAGRNGWRGCVPVARAVARSIGVAVVALAVGLAAWPGSVAADPPKKHVHSYSYETREANCTCGSRTAHAGSTRTKTCSFKRCDCGNARIPSDPDDDSCGDCTGCD